MSLPRDEGGADAERGDRGALPVGGREEVFIPMVNDGVGWLRICGPQHDAAAACLRVAEYIRLLEPGRPAGELEAAARGAAEELGRGAASAIVVNDRHRVERLAGNPGPGTPGAGTPGPGTPAPAASAKASRNED